MSFASSEVRAILKLTAPILATQLAQVGMGTIDTLMSGYVSTRDLAAVAIGSAVWTPVWLFLAGILVALSPAVAKANAANDAANLPKLLSTAIALGVTSGLILGALVAYIGWSIPVFVDDAHTAQVASQYLYAIAIGMPISGVFLALRFYAEALNAASHVTRIMLIGLALNIPINYVLIYGLFGLPELGGVGCGVGSATVLLIMSIAMLANTRKHRLQKNYALFANALRSRFSDLLALAKVGLPIGIAIFFEVSLFTAIALFLADLGPVVVAGHQVALNVASVTFMLPLSLGMAMTVRVGHHLGSTGKGQTGTQDAKRSSWLGVKLNLGLALFNAVLITLLAGFIANLYSPDPAVVAIGTSLLFFAALFQISDAIQIAAAGALRAYEDTFAVMLITFVAYWLIGFGSGWYLAYEASEPMGAAGFWIGLIIGLTFAAVALVARLMSISNRAETIIEKMQ